MKFYLVQMADGSKLLCSTQADAKSVSKEFTQFDIETDKDSLMAFAQDALNNIFKLETEIKELKALKDEAPEEAETEEQPAETVVVQEAPAPAQTNTPAPLTAMSVSFWLQDTATQAQIESVFQSLGTRFGEAIRRDRDQ